MPPRPGAAFRAWGGVGDLGSSSQHHWYVRTNHPPVASADTARISRATVHTELRGSYDFSVVSRQVV
jgi:hypothetical protein